MQLRHSPQDLSSQIPERRTLSVLFSDLRGFTALSETLDPEAVRELVNAYLSTALEALRMNQLGLDKIVGDSVMALSGAPDFYPDHAFRAVKCALEQQTLLGHLRRERKREGRPLPECGIGIHSGEVIFGPVGNGDLQEMTVLGASVNLASRMCQAAAGGQVLITEATLREILEHLPAGWTSKRRIQSAPPGVGVIHREGESKVESISELSSDLRGAIVEIGPEGRAVFRFDYLYAVKVKGVQNPIPVIEASSPEDVENQRLLTEDILQPAQNPDTRKSFGKYRILRSLWADEAPGHFQARDALGFEVILKLEPIADAAQDRHPPLELRMLDHPGVARLHDTGIYEDIRFTAFDFREGELWSSMEKRGAAFESAQAVRLTREWLSAQLHARGRGAVFGASPECPILFLRDGSLQILAAGRSGEGDERVALQYAARFFFRLLTGKAVKTGVNEIPPDLLASDADLRHILVNALQEDPGSGYRGLREFHADLGRWERDEPVQARSGAWWYLAGKKIKRHRRALLLSGLFAALCLSGVTLFWGEKLKEVATWRLAESVSPDPADGRWSTWYFPNWQEKNGSRLTPGDKGSHWIFDKETIRGGGFPGLDNLSFQSSVPGNIRVEWTRRGLEANEGYNCFLGGSNRFQAYTFHIAAWGDLRACVLTKGPGLDRLATVLMDEPLRPDRLYRFRMDAEGNRLRLFIDGRKWIDAEDPDAERGLGSWLIGFEANSGCIHEISRIKIYRQAPPEKNRAIAVAESWLAAGYYDLARRGYTEIVQLFPNTSMAPQAFYRLGRIETAFSNQPQAAAHFKNLLRQYPRSDYAPFALVELARIALKQGDTDVASRLADKLLRDFPASKRGRAAMFRLFDEHWNRWLQQFPIAGEDPKPFLGGVETARRELQDLALNFRQPLFDSAFFSGAAQRLRKLGHFSEITNHYASQGLAYRTTLLDLGEYRKVVEDPGSTLAVRSLALARQGNYPALFRLSSGHRGYQIVIAHTLINMGQGEKVFSHYPEFRDALSLAHLRAGRYAEVLRDHPDQGPRAAEALFYLGRDSEILARYPQTPAWILARCRLGEGARLFEEFPENRLVAARAHYLLRHYETAARDFTDIPEPAFYAAAALAVKAARERKPGMKNTWLTRLGDMPFDYSWPDFSGPLAKFLLPALLDLAGGRPDSVTAACEKILSDHREHFGKTLISTATLISSPEPNLVEWESQPTRTYLEARKWLSLAIRAETRRNSKEAGEAYLRYQALPIHQQLYSPFIDEWIAFRLEDLKPI